MATRTTLPGSGGTGDVDGVAFAASAVDKLPGGLAAYVEITADVTITTVADIGSLTFTAIASRTYIVEAMVPVVSTVANDVIRVTITDGSNTNLAVVEQAVPVANVDVMVPIKLRVQPSAGSTTYKVRGLRSSGTGVATSDPTSFSGLNVAYLIITDVGPSF